MGVRKIEGVGSEATGKKKFTIIDRIAAITGAYDEPPRADAEIVAADQRSA
ncbi:hypothetical protein KAJ02_10645 [Candidatus Bipolaricaulota bacterium]|nr:hypothetical protein [Candidatus Bipolaricaulota bacterium]MCK5586516.1 hypothetical protein [Candidatus Bipolaricaulota bacterium]